MGSILGISRGTGRGSRVGLQGSSMIGPLGIARRTGDRDRVEMSRVVPGGMGEAAGPD